MCFDRNRVWELKYKKRQLTVEVADTMVRPQQTLYTLSTYIHTFIRVGFENG